MNDTIPNLLRDAVDLQRQGRVVYACLIAKSRGSTPQDAGALMLVDDAGIAYGTIGGGCVEAEVRRRAFQMLVSGTSGLCRFTLNHDYGWDDGLICGGTLEIAIGPAPPPEAIEAALSAIARGETAEVRFDVQSEETTASFGLALTPPERLYIAGAGHVGQSLARFGLALGFEVTVFDDRADLMEKLLPVEAKKIPGDIARMLANAPVGPDTHCVIVTRGHRHDEQALHAVVGRGARYVGMIGSRRKVKLIFDDLEAMGVPRSELETVHAPIGVPIGASSVEEIGISIAAQLVQKRREGRSAPVVCESRGIAPVAD